MADEKTLERAKATYETLCRTLDNMKWKYSKNDETLSVQCGVQGDDLPIEIGIEVDIERTLVILLSRMPFVIQEDKRLDIAVAISAINNGLVDGCFDYDIGTGYVFFRMCNSFIDRDLGETLFAYMVVCSCHHVDEYNDKFLMISKGMLGIEQFIQELNKS